MFKWGGFSNWKLIVLKGKLILKILKGKVTSGFMSRDNSVLRLTTVALTALYDCLIIYELDIYVNNFKNYFKLQILYKSDLRISTAGELVEIVKNIKFQTKKTTISPK